MGNGIIGSAIVNYLLTEGFRVVVHDTSGLAYKDNIGHKNSGYLYTANSPLGVIANADCIFGCTGRDITQGIDVLELATGDKTFISCTSEDKEFLSLLKVIASVSREPFDPLKDISYTTERGKRILILAGGFPINFDKKPWSVPANDIEITRGLLFGACLQAMRCAVPAVSLKYSLTTNGYRLCLNPYIQRHVVAMWSSRQPEKRYSPNFFTQFHDVELIAAKSGGKYKPDSLLEQIFADIYNTYKKEKESPKSQLKT